MMKNIVAVIFICLGLNTIQGQNNYLNLLRDGNYEETILVAEKALKANTNDSMAFFALGAAYTNTNKYEAGNSYLDKAESKGVNFPVIGYYKIRNHVGLGNTQKAISILKTIAENGGNQFNRLEGDEFNGMADNAEFQALKRRIYLNARPCEGDENYRRFDFWVGEWEVFVGGNKMAESIISHSNDKCGILEDYKTTGVFAGNSISYYDQADQKWKQNWVANGRVSHFIEAKQPYEGNIAFITEGTNPQGSPTITRMTFFKNEDGSVRQFLETSTDDGVTWLGGFDGLYKKKM